MGTQADNTTQHHTLRIFDDELDHLSLLIMKMSFLVINQLEQTMQSLDNGDMVLAKKVVSQDKELNRFELEIDNEVQMALARRFPLASDLRTVLATSKIADELEKIGDEIADFARLVAVLFDPKTSDPNPQLLTDIVEIGNLVKIMLGKLTLIFENRETSQAYSLLQCDRECGDELQEGIRHQLIFAAQDGRLTGRALDIMHIMQALERCGEHCRNIAEYMIFMFEGIDVRHCEHAVTEKCQQQITKL